MHTSTYGDVFKYVCIYVLVYIFLYTEYERYVP